MGTAAVNLQPAIDKLTPMGIKVAAMDFQPIRGNDAYAREAHYEKDYFEKWFDVNYQGVWFYP